MTAEAKMEDTGKGLLPSAPGWFVLNLKDAHWVEHAKFGQASRLQLKYDFPHVGLHVHILQPGQPNCHYHSQECQEDFLVLEGECKLLVNGEERPLKKWDHFHCTPHTAHVFVGAGEGPCAILMIGAKKEDEKLFYPIDPVAQKYDACAKEETPDPAVSYAGLPRGPSRSQPVHGP